MKFSLKKLIPTFVRRNLPPDKLMLNPKKDWKTIVIIFSAVNLLIIVFNLYFFQKMSSGEFFEVPMEETVSIESINKKILVERVGLGPLCPESI